MESKRFHHTDQDYPPVPRIQAINKKEWDALSVEEQTALFEEMKKNRAAHRRQPVSPHIDKLLHP